jgi:hypothetical protein
MLLTSKTNTNHQRLPIHIQIKSFHVCLIFSTTKYYSCNIILINLASQAKSVDLDDNNSKRKTFEIISGEPFVEKKSKFVAHIARIKSEEEAKQGDQCILLAKTKLTRQKKSCRAAGATRQKDCASNTQYYGVEVARWSAGPRRRRRGRCRRSAVVHARSAAAGRRVRRRDALVRRREARRRALQSHFAGGAAVDRRAWR